MLKRQQLNQKIKDAASKSSGSNSKKELENCIIRYYRCAKVLFDEKNAKRIQNFLRNIINKQDNDGKTPLHYAVKYWPQDIVQHLLKWGADVSIKDKKLRIPLKKVPKSTLLDLLDNHCMKSDGICTREDTVCNSVGQTYAEACIGEVTNNDGQQEDEDEEWRKYGDMKQLLNEYEPRFMTDITKSSVTFDYGMLAPTPYISPVEYGRKGGLKSMAQPEMSVLSEISKSKKHQDVIKHPVVKSYVWMKWLRIQRFYHRDLRADVLLLWFLT